MLRQVQLERFRGFERLDACLSPATVVVGPNSSGKTTLLHAIRFALTAFDDSLNAGTSRLSKQRGADGWIEVVNQSLIPDYTRYLPLAPWESLFYRQRTGENQNFTIHLSFDETDDIRAIELCVTCARNSQLKLDISIHAPLLATRIAPLPKKTGQINREIVSFVEQHAARAVFIPSFYGVVREEEYRSGVVMDRLLGAGDQSHIVRNLVSRLSAEAFTRLNAFLNESINAQLSERTTSQDSDLVYPLVVRFRDDDGPLELSAAGAGLINLIALYTALERYRGEQRQRPVVFLLDEPEAHLHPRLQGEMAGRVASLIVREFGSQVVMATHSVEIVNRLSGRDDAVVLRVDRSAPQVSVLRGQSAIINEIGEWADLSPFSMINFLASRQILFHEGSSDKTILETCAKLRYRSDLARRERFEQWTFASLSGSGDEKIAGLLARLIKTQVVPALADGAPVELLVVLDRDYEREPGVHEEPAKDRVRATRLVWSAHSIESLFLQPAILHAWLQLRFGGAAPAELRPWIDAAVAAADADAALNREAEGQLLAQIIKRGLSKAGQPLRGEQLSVTAHREATASVQNSPATWQRGHSRSRFVLGEIRAKLPPELRGQFPTNIHNLLETSALDGFGDPERPIPVEIRELLDRMTAPPRTT
jgi:hypothetical protein